jgi:hypothetical protein
MRNVRGTRQIKIFSSILGVGHKALHPEYEITGVRSGTEMNTARLQLSNDRMFVPQPRLVDVNVNATGGKVQISRFQDLLAR